MAALKWLLRAGAIGAALAWAWLCWRAAHGSESPAAEEWRTVLFVAAFALASFAWTPKPPKPGGRNKERF